MIHLINTNTNTLTVYSKDGIVVVSDPGASFLYEEIWLVEMPTQYKPNVLKEYRYELPEHAVADKIHPLRSSVPPEILKVAEENKWK